METVTTKSHKIRIWTLDRYIMVFISSDGNSADYTGYGNYGSMYGIRSLQNLRFFQPFFFNNIYLFTFNSKTTIFQMLDLIIARYSHSRLVF